MSLLIEHEVNDRKINLDFNNEILFLKSAKMRNKKIFDVMMIRKKSRENGNVCPDLQQHLNLQICNKTKNHLTIVIYL